MDRMFLFRAFCGLTLAALAAFTAGCELDDGGSCPGPKSAVDSRQFPLSCIVYAQLRVEPESLAIAATNVGESSEGELFVRNDGDTTGLVMLAFDPPDAAFSTEMDSFALPPGARAPIQVVFRPTVEGMRATTLSITCPECSREASAQISGEAR
jgi:hypothetical protein